MIVKLVLDVRALCSSSLRVIQSAAVAGHGKVHKVSETRLMFSVRVVYGGGGGCLPKKKSAGIRCEGEVTNRRMVRLTLEIGIPIFIVIAIIAAMIPSRFIPSDEDRKRQ